MASVFQVEETLAAIVETAVYPDGEANPSVVGVDVKIVTGIPVKKTLDEYLNAGKAFVSINSIERMDRNVTRYSKEWHTISVDTATIGVGIARTDVSDYGVTLTGTITAGQLVVLQLGATVYTHAVLVTDTLDSIATALAALIPGGSAVANVISFSTLEKVTGGVSVSAIAAQEIKRQQKIFCVSIWSPTNEFRDTLGEAIDLHLSDIERFVLPDDFYARIIYTGTIDRDGFQVHRLYKRELDYSIEYPTTRTKTFNTLVVTELQLEDNAN